MFTFNSKLNTNSSNINTTNLVCQPFSQYNKMSEIFEMVESVMILNYDF